MTAKSNNTAVAARLEQLVRARGEYGHVTIRAHGNHLVVEVDDGSGAKDPTARATSLGGGIYGVSFHSHTGRWEPVPIQGTLEDVAEALTIDFGPYLDRGNLA